MVGVTKIQRGNASYWLEAVAEGGEDYYTKPGEAPGEWVGGLAKELELFGEVDAAAYTAILEGKDPRDGVQLVRRPVTRMRQLPDGSEKRVEPVLGYDVRFSAPKSVSILYALGDEDIRARLLGVMNEAVRQGLAHLEEEACLVQRGQGGKELERGQGFVGMAFRHRMSRAGEPALHVHVVISNLTRALSDGKWLSLASPKGRSPLWPHAKSAGVVFQAALRAGFLREFGLEFEPVTRGYADLKGFDRGAIDALSTRSKEIGEWLRKRGFDSVKAAQVAAYRTRPKKDHGLDEDARRAEWEAAATPHGIDGQSLAEMIERAEVREPRRIATADLDAALAKLEETSAHFDRRALLWALCDELPEGADLASLTAAVDAVIAGDRVVCIHRSASPIDPSHYTTPRIAELERRFIEGALASTDAGIARVESRLVDSVLGRHSRLGTDQWEMVRRLTEGGEQVIAVAAWPGTGKTTAVSAAQETWELAGVPVVGCATARTAALELMAVGLRSTTIRRLLDLTDRRRAEGRQPLPAGTVIILDEASMTSTFDMEALRLLAVECGGKLVAIGDPRQIGAIGPGGTYAYLTRATEPVTLQTIRRQEKEVDRQMIALVYEGRGSEALDLLRSEERLVVGDDLPRTLDAMLLDWHRDYSSGADVVMIARRNRDVSYLNDCARELRREQGALGDSEVIVGERAFSAGDRVQTRVNREGVSNRERWDVVDADAGARTLRLRHLVDGHCVTLGPKYLNRLRDDGGASVEHAYALTNYGVQGKTVDRAHVFLDGDTTLEQGLVASSRGREVANVYAVASSELLDPELGPGRREIGDSLHDIRAAIEREGNDYAAAELELRLKISLMSDRELVGRRAELARAGDAATPLLDARERSTRAIKRGQAWQKALGREREALEAMREPPPAELARVIAAERGVTERLRRNEARLAGMPEVVKDPAALPLDPDLRLEASLIESRIERLVRREVEAGRLEPRAAFHDALGPYPADDPNRARAWQEGAHVIATYRRRNGLRHEAEALGLQPSGSAERSEWTQARRSIERVQRELSRSGDLAMGRVIEVSHAIER
jgi:conjugative relaxase-like TrwC/TraI family protein